MRSSWAGQSFDRASSTATTGGFSGACTDGTAPIARVRRPRARGTLGVSHADLLPSARPSRRRCTFRQLVAVGLLLGFPNGSAVDVHAVARAVALEDPGGWHEVELGDDMDGFHRNRSNHKHGAGHYIKDEGPSQRLVLESDVRVASWQEIDATKAVCAMKETALMDDHQGSLAGLSLHGAMCDRGSFLQQFAMVQSEDKTKYKIVFKCCALTKTIGRCDEVSSPLKGSEKGSLAALTRHAALCPGQALMRGWQLQEVGGDVSMHAVCCDMGEHEQLWKCKDATTQPTEGYEDARLLTQHPVSCKEGSALTRWVPQVQNLKDVFLSYTCCASSEGTDLAVGPRRTCRWVGDPHFLTFDNGRHDTTMPSLGGTFWVVKSDDVKIQSYYEGMTANSPALTKAIIVFGRFLHGHKLIIKKDVARLRQPIAGSLLEQTVVANASAPQPLPIANVVTWDGQEVPNDSEFIVKGIAAISRKGGHVRAALPRGVVLEVMQNSHWMDQAVTMSQAPGGQEGQCGNNNGDAGDDFNLMDSYPVAAKDNMLLPEATPDQDNKAPLLSDCIGSKRRRAVEMCRKQFIANDTLQDYLNMCIFDACFSDTPEELVKQDQVAERAASEDLQARRPRRFRSVGLVEGSKQAEACADGTVVAKITSAAEQKAVMEAIVSRKRSPAYIWGGAVFHKGQWRWADGHEMCGFENWDVSMTGKILRPPHITMCISKRTGKWKTCAPSRRLPTVCADPKMFVIEQYTGPLQARKSCGAEHAMAMPKSAADHNQLMQYLSSRPLAQSYIWLGASWKNNRWEWDDGSKVCWANWDKGEPQHKGTSDQMWVIMHAQTGKWKATTGYDTFHHVLCENQMAEDVCTPSRIRPQELMLSRIPEKQWSYLGGHCYYMGRGGESCHETCFRQMDGFCSQAGLNAAVRSKGTCKFIAQGFGGIAQDSHTRQDPGESGCTYKDMGIYGTSSLTEVIVESAPHRPPTCEARTSNPKHHRICACGSSYFLQYPLKHVVTTGDTVRACAQGYSTKEATKIELVGEKGVDILGMSLSPPAGAEMQKQKHIDEDGGKIGEEEGQGDEEDHEDEEEEHHDEPGSEEDHWEDEDVHPHQADKPDLEEEEQHYQEEYEHEDAGQEEAGGGMLLQTEESPTERHKAVSPSDLIGAHIRLLQQELEPEQGPWWHRNGAQEDSMVKGLDWQNSLAQALVDEELRQKARSLLDRSGTDAAAVANLLDGNLLASQRSQLEKSLSKKGPADEAPALGAQQLALLREVSKVAGERGEGLLAGMREERAKSGARGETTGEGARMDTRNVPDIPPPDAHPEAAGAVGFATVVALDATGSSVVMDVGEEVFNGMFNKCPFVAYYRDKQLHSVYLRMTDPREINAYEVFTKTWTDVKNELGRDFAIYDNIGDARSNALAWEYCNYNKAGIGYPADCGRSGEAPGDLWFALPGSQQKMENLTHGASLRIYAHTECPSPVAGWTTAVALQREGDVVSVDIGEQKFNQLFHACPLVLYHRNGGVHSVYRRFTSPFTINPYYLFTTNWTKDHNLLDKDFRIYSSFEEAIKDENGWTFCDFDEPDVGYPRNCAVGSSGDFSNQWFTLPGGAQPRPKGIYYGSGFAIYTGASCPYHGGDGVGFPKNTVWMWLKQSDTYQSSTTNNGFSSRAVDGDSTVYWNGDSCTHTAYQENPWWMVDLGSDRKVRGVKVTNRGDCCGWRLSPFHVFVDRQHCTKSTIEQGQTLNVKCDRGDLIGSKVTIILYKTTWLTLCEVGVAIENQLVDAVLPKNVVWLKMGHDKTMQSSTAFEGVPSRAVDGDYSGQWRKNSCTHTMFQDNPWWFVDLGEKKKIQGLKVSNRADCCGNRLSPFYAFVDKTLCATSELYQGMVLTVACKPETGLIGRFVTIKLFGPKRALSICEVGVAVDPSFRTGPLTKTKGNAKALEAAAAAASSVPDVIPFAFRQNAFPIPGRTLTSLEFIPWKRAVVRTYVGKEGGIKDEVSTIPWWSMRDEEQPWCVDLRATEHTWKVHVNGMDFPELEMYREKGDYITGLRTTMHYPHYLLIPPEATLVSEPVSVNTINGCKEHTFQEDASTITFSFRLKPFALEGNPCVRCEPRPVDEGSHLYFHGRRLVFTVDGARPRVQTFHRVFQPMKKYAIDISYISLENVVELYVNSLRVEVLTYKNAPRFPLRDGRLGCASHSQDDGRMFKGVIINFQVKNTLHRNRPQFDLCIHYSCKSGSYPKREPQRDSLVCKGPVCLERDQDTCCEPSMRCDEFRCESGSVKKLAAGNTSCEGEACKNHECCDVVASCATFQCPVGMMLKHDPHEILCAEARCSEEMDALACCIEVSTCHDFECPSHYALRHDADKVFCEDEVCKDTEYTKCCAEHGRCSTVACYEGHVHIALAAYVACHEAECAEDDHDLCCEPLASCSSLVCKDGYVHTEETKMRTCGAAFCTEEYDHEVCCVERPWCTTMTCPPQSVMRANASHTRCEDAFCKDTDHTMCCEHKGRCSSHQCPERFVLKDDADALVCDGASCKADVDDGTCCDHVARCSSMLCPTAYLPKPNEELEKLLCRSRNCSMDDRDTCCAKEGTCESLQCPAGHVLIPKANETFCAAANCSDANFTLCCDRRAPCTDAVCKAGRVLRMDSDELKCKGKACTSADDDTCCVDKQSCASMQCPSGMVHRPNITNIMCYLHGCDNRTDDVLYCCDRRANCSTMACPRPMLVNRPDAASRLCRGAECDITSDNSTCCMESGTCSSLSCPAGHVHRPKASELHCLNKDCNRTSANFRMCCQPVARCSTFSCPHNMSLRANATRLRCESDICHANEREKCCERRGKCSDYRCPNSTVHKANAYSILCSDPKCENTAWDECCTERGTCLTWSCPADHIHRWNASRILCKHRQCTATDTPACCEQATPCHQGACFSNMTLKPGADQYCQARTCDPRKDSEFCCLPRAKCNSFSCPEYFLPKPRASQLFCRDVDCKDEDYKRCCQQRATCSTFQCPPHDYVLREGHSSLFCKGLHCRDDDRDTCCNPRARCDSVKCPAGKVAAHDAANRTCAGSSCSFLEINSCCAPSPTCASVTCPSGQVYRPGAMDSSLNEATHDNVIAFCCEPRGQCKEHMCPSGYIMHSWRPGDSHPTCQGLEHLCLLAYHRRGCSALSSSTECAGSYAYDTMGSLARCEWTHGTCRTTLREAERCHGLTFSQLQDACEALTCMHRVRLKAGGRLLTSNATFTRLVKGMPSEAFHVQGCTEQGQRGRLCSKVWGVPGGAQIIRNRLGHAVATGSCCTEAQDTVLSVQSRCRRLNASEGMLGHTCHTSMCAFEECCSAASSCSSLLCPVGMQLKSGAGNVHCKGSYCTEEDVQTCCEALGMCADYVCPKEYAKRQDEAQRYCASVACTETDYNNCCAHENRCSTLACLDGYVHKPPSNHTFCPSGKCTETDHDLCCAARAACTSMPPSLCAHGTHVTANASLRCAGSTCTGDDSPVCCEIDATCDWFDCPKGYIRRPHAEEIWCEGASCQRTDYRTCCWEPALCSSMTCPPGHTLRSEAALLACQSSPCSLSVDLDLCCEKNQVCEAMACPIGFAVSSTAREVPCQGRLCSEHNDFDRCCAPRASCRNLQCPEPMWTHRNLSILEMSTHKAFLCAGDTCSWSMDNATCCEQRANCTKAACPDGHVLRTGAEQRTCHGSRCDPGLDGEACCEPASTCANFKCPEAYTLRPNAQMVRGDIRQMDYRACCLPRDRCSSFQCPPKYVRVDNSADVPCQGAHCTTKDTNNCCSPVAMCHSYDCPAGFIHRPKPETIACRRTTCTDRDVHTCCIDEQTCSSYKCPGGMVHRPNAFTIDCVEGNCNQTQESACCAARGSCTSLACPAGMVHKEEAVNLVCQSGVCTLHDALHCCETAAACVEVTCPKLYKLVDYPEKMLCKHANCSSADFVHCCIAASRCASYRCPSGYSRRHNAESLQCYNKSCIEHAANTQQCCVKDASCLTYRCPNHMRHREGAENIMCRDVLCRDADKYRCCVNHAKALQEVNGTTETRPSAARGLVAGQADGVAK